MSERVPENFIPWEQIEPLVREGMTGVDLYNALNAMVGFKYGQYYYRCRVRGATLLDSIRDGGGVTIMRSWADPVPNARELSALTAPIASEMPA